MRKYLLILFTFSSIYAVGQKTKAPKIPDPTPFAKTITAEDLKKHLYIVAGPEMEGRETATEGQRKAAAYIENYFKSLGLAPGNKESFQQQYPVFQDSLVNASIEVNGKKFEVNKDFAVNMGAAYSATMFGSEVVFVGYGISDSTRDDYAGINARGKIVLVLAGNPPAPAANNNNNNNNNTGRRFNPFAKQDAAAKNGAAAILEVQTNFPRRQGSARGNQYVSGFRRAIYPNTFAISEAVAESIMGADYAAAKESAKTGTTTAKLYTANVMLDFSKYTIKMESSNVIGFLEGTDLKDEYVVLTAHYDHLGKRENNIFYGADDDGSGTVSVLELAEAFVKAKAAGKGPRRSIIFMTVSGEEKGLWGSAYYGDHPTYPLEKTTVNLNIDMIGRIDPKRTNGDSTNYVYVVGDDKLSSDLKPISEAVNKKYTKLELDYKYNDPKDTERIYYRSDHFNFARKGVPIIFYFNGTHADYHRATDTPDKIDYPQMSKRAQLVFYTAWEMANRNDMLKRDIPLDAQFR
jgi:Zn-dependent M28 family amino/carboxypeptidase